MQAVQSSAAWVLNLIGCVRETPLKGTLLNHTFGSVNRDVTERVYTPKGPP